MYAEKFELLEAKIRETAMLVSRLREEKRQLEQENEQLRERLYELEEELRRAQTDSSQPASCSGAQKASPIERCSAQGPSGAPA